MDASTLIYVLPYTARVVGAEQPIHWFFGGRATVFRHGTSVLVGVPYLNRVEATIPDRDPSGIYKVLLFQSS